MWQTAGPNLLLCEGYSARYIYGQKIHQSQYYRKSHGAPNTSIYSPKGDLFISLNTQTFSPFSFVSSHLHFLPGCFSIYLIPLSPSCQDVENVKTWLWWNVQRLDSWEMTAKDSLPWQVPPSPLWQKKTQERRALSLKKLLCFLSWRQIISCSSSSTHIWQILHHNPTC